MPKVAIILNFCLFFIGTQSFSQNVGENYFSMSFEDLMNLKVTTSEKYETSMKDTHSSMRVISGSELKLLGIETLAEMLNTIQGYYINNDRNYSYVGVQGFSQPSDYNSRILLMIDNHALNENVYGSALLDKGFGIDLQLVEKVEVITGPGAALYGNGAMLAVVNVITMSALEKEPENFLNVSVGSQNSFSSSVALKDQTNKLNYFITGNYSKTAGENLYFEELDNGFTSDGKSIGLDDEEVYATYFNLSYKDLSLRFLSSHRLKGIPTGAWETDLNKRSQSIDDRAFLELSYKKKMGSHTLNYVGSWDLYRYEGIYGYSDYDSYWDRSMGMWGNIQIDYQFQINQNSCLSSGVELHYSLKSDYKEVGDDEVLFYRNNKFYNYSAFVQYDHKFNEKTSLLAGLRLDDYSYTKASLSPRVSLVYTPTDKINSKLSINKAFRAPTFYELYYEVDGENTSNPDLDPENIYHFSMDVNGEVSKKITAGISLFGYHMHNMVYPKVTDQGLVMFVNKGHAAGHGLSISGDGRLFKNLNIISSYTCQYMEMIDSEGDKTVGLNSPNHIIKNQLIYQLPNVGSFSYQLLAESGRTGFEGNTDASFVSSMNLRTTQLFGKVVLNLKINNLFNETYYNPSGIEHTISQIVQPGIHGLLTIEVEL